MGRCFFDIRYAVRSFLKAPGFTTVAIIVLALGVGANSAIFTIVNALLLKPLPGRAGSVVGLYASDRTKPDSYRAFSYPNYADIRDRSGVFDQLAGFTFAMVGVPAGGRDATSHDTTRRTFTAVVSSNYFETLDVPLAIGRPFTKAEEQPGARTPAVIVSYVRWKDAGLDPGFLGTTIRINAEDFTVVGVAPEGFTGTVALVAPEMWVPLGMFDVVVNDMFKNNGRPFAERGNDTLVVVGRVKGGLSDEGVKARLDALARQLAETYPAENPNMALSVAPLSRMATSTQPQSDAPLTIAMALLMGLSGLVLLIACLNLANMLLARGSVRKKEIALRLALGAGRSRLIRQLLTESLMLAVAGASIGLALAYAAARMLGTSLAGILPIALEFRPEPDVRVFAATLTLVLVSTIGAGLGPALKLSRGDLVTDLKDSVGDQGSRRRRFSGRNMLVASQVALSLGLLSAAGLFAQAAVKGSSADPGFSYDRHLLVTVDPTLASIDEAGGRVLQRTLLERLRAVPGIEAVGAASTVPFGDFHEGHGIEGLAQATAGQPASATFRIVGRDYFRALGLPILRGRDFTLEEESSSGAARVAIVDELLAKQIFGNQDPIGQQVRIAGRGVNKPGEALTVVGIAPPLREEIVDRSPIAHLYVPWGANYRGTMHLHVRVAQAGTEAALLQQVRGELRAIDPRLPVLELTTMAGFHDRSIGLWMLRAGGRMFMLLGGLALLLAIVGLYGVRSYVVSQRTREIGIRMALGADGASVRWLVLREGLLVTAAGLAVGMPIAAGLGALIGSTFYGLDQFDPVVFFTAPVVLAVAALVASYIPARRATTVAPLEALRDL